MLRVPVFGEPFELLLLLGLFGVEEEEEEDEEDDPLILTDTFCARAREYCGSSLAILFIGDWAAVTETAPKKRLLDVTDCSAPTRSTNLKFKHLDWNS